MAQRTTVFVSYSHKDEKWRKRLEVHLLPYIRGREIDLWSDAKIRAGDLWRPAIREAIDRAAASVLLLSADFLASEFVVSEELPRLLEKAKKGGARVLSITIKPCALQEYPEITCFQALNPPDRPVSLLKSASRVEDFFATAAASIAELLDQPGGTTSPRPAQDDDTNDDLFEELKSATVLLSIVTALSGGDGQLQEYTVGELVRLLQIQSRKTGYEALEQLLQAGWIQKRRVDSKQTKFSMTAHGVRQLHRLSAAASGPVRSAR